MNEEQRHQDERLRDERMPAVRRPSEPVPVKLPEQHQRFYDKLRAKIEAFIREKGGSEKAAAYILLAPDLFVLLARLLLDKRVGVQAKAVAGIAVAYFITPIDFIPEALTGTFGLLDDVVLAVYALRRILVDVDEAIVREHWNGEEDLLQVITKVVKSADELVGKKLVRKIEETLFRKK
ncbi:MULTISPECIES: YkvA family protein [Brevibacillus]|jgi:uncharacterized membrane protein YkvA (DUF1232 family)|uniref:YkvA family protein n=1 Tax=Brevibacillus TaxID=55080 RepID=UPI00040C9EC3|nr:MULTISPECIES: YkvA family protein [Brevibacillus]TRY24270.1 DUF1232 domain-containing protein [Brevibacillus sp. LEMMJ03]UYZ14701.1 YkvA family protein [Brevibacillus sp. WF146]